MVDTVVLGPFPPQISLTLLSPGGVPSTPWLSWAKISTDHPQKGLKVYDDLFRLLPSIGYFINVCITGPIKAQHSTSAS